MIPPIRSPKVEGLDINKRKALLVDRQGRMLWMSPAWAKHHEIAPLSACLDLNYLEFVHPDDGGGLLAYFANPKQDMHRYRCMEPGTGRMFWISILKVPYRIHWLCICTTQLAPILPAPPCIADYYTPETTPEEQ